MQTILVVEDEEDITTLLTYNLERAGFRVLSAADGHKGLELAQSEIPDLVLLDLMIPGIDGLEVCRLLRQEAKTREIPIIMVTAKSEESDVVIGLGIGADDYVTKPFSPKEVIARIKSVMRRGANVKAAPGTRIEVGPLVLDPARHEVQLHGKPVTLTLAEFIVLKSLMENQGEVLSREQLVGEITGGEAVIIDRNIDVHIRALRKKLDVVADEIISVRGIGYKFRD